jgi:hypothetical protein
MSEQDQVHPVLEFNPMTQEQLLCTIWRPTTKTFQVILETFPGVTPTQATGKHRMSYCLEQIIDIDRPRLHFALKEVLMCHVCHYLTSEQARLKASQACQPDNLPVVSLTAGGFANVLGSRVALDKLVEAPFKALGFLLGNLCLPQ